MEVFKDYATYYDLLYADKDYPSEAAYVLSLVSKICNSPASWLDLGCGSGRHAIEFSKENIAVTGVDQSETMLQLGKEVSSDIEFMEGDIQRIRLNKKFDVVTALFHVMSYQITDKALENTLKTVDVHLNDIGVFVFDCWYGPAVLHDKPYSRSKTFENEKLKIERTSVPFLDEETHTVKVNFTIKITDKLTQTTHTLKETHLMRYLFVEEVKELLENNGFELLIQQEWMTGKPLSKNTWYATFAARKNG